MPQIPKSHCLKCNAMLDGAQAANASDVLPKAGDVTVCVYCGHIMEFGPNQKLVELSDAALVECAGNPELLHAMKVSGQFQERYKKEKGR